MDQTWSLRLLSAPGAHTTSCRSGDPGAGPRRSEEAGWGGRGQPRAQPHGGGLTARGPRALRGAGPGQGQRRGRPAGARERCATPHCGAQDPPRGLRGPECPFGSKGQQGRAGSGARQSPGGVRVCACVSLSTAMACAGPPWGCVGTSAGVSTRAAPVPPGTSPGPGRTGGPWTSPSAGSPLPPPPGQPVTRVHRAEEMAQIASLLGPGLDLGPEGRATHPPAPEGGGTGLCPGDGVWGGARLPSPFLSLEFPGSVDPSRLPWTPTALSSL